MIRSAFLFRPAFATCRRYLASSAARQSGTVKFYIRKKAYGFIIPDSGAGDLFVHRADIDSDTDDLIHPFLQAGERVSFETTDDLLDTPGDELPRAKNVRWLNGSLIPPLRKGFYAIEIEKTKAEFGEKVWEAMQEHNDREETLDTILSCKAEAEERLAKAEELIARLGMNVADFPTKRRVRNKPAHAVLKASERGHQ